MRRSFQQEFEIPNSKTQIPNSKFQNPESKISKSQNLKISKFKIPKYQNRKFQNPNFKNQLPNPKTQILNSTPIPRPASPRVS